MTNPQPWRGIFCGNSTMAKEPIKGLIVEFMNFYMRSENRSWMAVFMHTTDRDEQGNDEVTLYFTPAAAEFAKAIPQAVVCEQPAGDGLVQIAGNPMDLLKRWHPL